MLRLVRCSGSDHTRPPRLLGILLLIQSREIQAEKGGKGNMFRFTSRRRKQIEGSAVDLVGHGSGPGQG